MSSGFSEWIIFVRCGVFRWVLEQFHLLQCSTSVSRCKMGNDMQGMECVTLLSPTGSLSRNTGLVLSPYRSSDSSTTFRPTPLEFTVLPSLRESSTVRFVLHMQLT